MKITILLFGIVKDIAGTSTLEIENEEINTVLSVKVFLVKKFPELEKYPNFSIAVNEAYEEDNYTLQPGDVVAIIPPVSGG